LDKVIGPVAVAAKQCASETAQPANVRLEKCGWNSRLMPVAGGRGHIAAGALTYNGFGDNAH
jgi:hypothetical protein